MPLKRRIKKFMKNNGGGAGGIVLFAKCPGVTSFSSLFTIKHALDTSKVGHTGTLDSFASGLLVVCTGALTRLASRITGFGKTYDAVIEFGSETDTLEWTGKTVREAPLPSEHDVESAVMQMKGVSMQIPPLFSALHIDGQRASDIARSGREADMPAREITVFDVQTEEYLRAGDGRVKAVRAMFTVSKGTYIRSIARDIGKACGSAAHLAGLRRLSVGSFRLEDAAGAELLAPFTISTVYESVEAQKKAAPGNEGSGKKFTMTEQELKLQEDVRRKLQPMTERTAEECGFGVLHLASSGACDDFSNGRPLRKTLFAEKNAVTGTYAVFTPENRFAGVIETSPDHAEYSFVIH